MKEQLIVSPTDIAQVLGKTETRSINEADVTIKREGFSSSRSNLFSLPNEERIFKLKVRNELQEAIKILGQTEALPGIFATSNHKMASLLQTFIAQKGLEEKMIVEDESLFRKSREVKFDEHDWLGWAGSFFSWWKKIVPHSWLDTPSDKKINNNARIGILGDWGTGLYGAPICARSIEQDKNDYDVILHLGDVYYSGDVNEVKERFLDIWIDPAKTVWKNKDNVLHRACNGNHEMYTGGHSYFKYILSKFEQSASYFALHNDYWILAGLDTGYKDGDLGGYQAEWLADLVSRAEGRKVILFSHHQPFSWFDKGYSKITKKLDNLLSQKKIFAWYWGHEHRCALYDSHPLYGLYGRCMGHSGYPYFRDNFDGIKSESTDAGADQDLKWKIMPEKSTSPGARILDGPNQYVEGYINKFGPNGYLTLDFADNQLNETVQAADGTVLFSRSLE